MPQEIYNTIIPVFSNPHVCPPFAWPGADWDWIPQSHWSAPNGTYCICGSYLWVWLPHGWIGRCTLGLTFTHGFIFSELPEKPTNLPHLKLIGQDLYFTGIIIWLQYSFPLWVIMLQVDALINFRLLMLNKHKLGGFTKQIAKSRTRLSDFTLTHTHKTDWP